jgi:hypothetical protein
LFRGNFRLRLGFRFCLGFRLRFRFHRGLLGRRFLRGRLLGGRFFHGGFRLGFRRRRGRGGAGRGTPVVHDLEDHRSPASGGKAEAFRGALGKIHNAAFGGGYTARNGCGYPSVVSGVYDLYLGS